MATAVLLEEPSLDPDGPKAEDQAPLMAVHTPNFPALLRQLGASLMLTNCTVSGNSTTGNGGGLSNDHAYGLSSTLALFDCTVSGNSAVGGGGISNVATRKLALRESQASLSPRAW
jgi:hypothetical protein